MHKPNDYYTHLFANSQPRVPALGLMKFASKPTKGVFSEEGWAPGLGLKPPPWEQIIRQRGTKVKTPPLTIIPPCSCISFQHLHRREGRQLKINNRVAGAGFYRYSHSHPPLPHIFYTWLSILRDLSMGWAGSQVTGHTRLWHNLNRFLNQNYEQPNYDGLDTLPCTDDERFHLSTEPISQIFSFDNVGTILINDQTSIDLLALSAWQSWFCSKSVSGLMFPGVNISAVWRHRVASWT